MAPGNSRNERESPVFITFFPPQIYCEKEASPEKYQNCVRITFARDVSRRQ